MHYSTIKRLCNKDFQRLTGVRRETYNKILSILRPEETKKYQRGGRPPKLNLEDQLFMTLEYWREYRTYFHIGKNYGISESSAYKTIRWIENILVYYHYLIGKII